MLGAVTAVALLSGLAFWLLHGRPAFSFNQRESVLVTDFENQTGDTRFDEALRTAFIVSLEQSRHANVFPQIELALFSSSWANPARNRSLRRWDAKFVSARMFVG